jgi:fatty-acid desaturase
MKTNWFRLLLPVWDMLMTISDDGAGPDQISLNNQQLVREMNNREWMKGRRMSEEEINELRKRIKNNTNKSSMKNYKQIWYWLRAIIVVAVTIGVVTEIIINELIARIFGGVLIVGGLSVLVWAVKGLLGSIFGDDDGDEDEDEDPLAYIRG